MSDVESRKPGRPPGSRNKVDIRKDVTRALTNGHNLTSLKEYLEGYIVELRIAKADGKVILQALKQHYELMRFLIEKELTFQEPEGGKKPKGGDGGGSDEDEENDGVVIFDFSKKKS